MSGSLVHSPQDVVRYLLIDNTQGTLPSDNDSWPIYTDNEPESPDNCVTIYGVESRDVGRRHVDGRRIEFHGIQVRVRSMGSQTGYIKARQIAVSLDEDVLRDTVTISGSVYLVHSVDRVGDVIRLGKEKPNSNRYIYTINAVSPLRQTS